MSFLRNRSFNIKMVKDQSVAGEEGDSNYNPFEPVEVAAAYAEVAKDFITHTALTIGGVYAACKIVERLCK